MAEVQAEQTINPPTAGASKTISDALSDASDTDAEETQKKTRKTHYIYAGRNTLNPYDGVFYGPSGKESYYNLPMEKVVEYMQAEGFNYSYWVRKDGVKMFGDYVMVAADLTYRPKGTILATSLGPAMVCDTGEFIYIDSTALDVAVAW